MPDLLAEKLRALRGDKSVKDLSHATVRVGHVGVGERTIQLLESAPGRVPDADILEALAAALGVEPDEFYEYPIAVRRREAGSTVEARKKREAEALRKRAQRQGGRLVDAPDTTPAPRRRKGQAP
jgi:transcriptional regulator with XRE-family HTH domain